MACVRRGGGPGGISGEDAKERLEAARAKSGRGGSEAPARRTARPKSDDGEMVTGRNSVLESLRAKIPATTLYIASRIEMDDRVKEALSLATKCGLNVLEVMRPELDRLSGHDAVHQGIALKVPPYQYAHPLDLLDAAIESGRPPLLVALDGVTDPRNLAAKPAYLLLIEHLVSRELVGAAIPDLVVHRIVPEDGPADISPRYEWFRSIVRLSKGHQLQERVVEAEENLNARCLLAASSHEDFDLNDLPNLGRNNRVCRVGLAKFQIGQPVLGRKDRLCRGTE